ncbi:MarR family winged helix-turn-helix transcriptional regulator [Herbiconiux sp. P15]|uniref:MarR family winged helix-turn-helix transcriptional regulator n=1 Tax=Herbiconiux liukaitaii TaxID=3342799 RepID=UPI0035BA3C07
MSSEERAEAILAVEGEMARIVRATRAFLLENAARFSSELSPSGFWVLRYIVKNAPTSPGAIVAQVGMDKSVVSRQLRVLKDLGFVTSVPDPSDGRASLFEPTPATLLRMDDIRHEVQAAYSGVLDDWSDDDVRSFVRLLGEFNDRLERR